MQNQQDIIKDLLEKDSDELYINIGSELYGSAAFPPSPKQLRQVAYLWLQNKRADIAKVICPNEQVRMLISNGPTIPDRIMLVTAIADLITSIVIGVSPITVAVLLVKEGLKTLCEDNEV